jgi:hypothetical protein
MTMSPSTVKGVGSAGAYPVSFETWRPIRTMMSDTHPPVLTICGDATERSTLSLALIIRCSIQTGTRLSQPRLEFTQRAKLG